MDALKKAAIKSFDLIRKNSDIDELKAVGDIVDICYYYAERKLQEQVAYFQSSFIPLFVCLLRFPISPKYFQMFDS